MIYPLILNPFDQSDIDTLISTIKTGFFTMGSQVKAFERAFANKVGSKFAVMTNSGSSANLISAFAFLYLKNKNLGPNDEVLVPAIGWSTTWSPLQQAGFKIKVVDVNPETLNVDVSAYENAITPNTKMVVTVSILGNPLEFERLSKICKEKGIFLFEDNCESIGATVGGKWCGTFGDVGTFSFFYSHHISTMEGGMVVTDNEELYHILLSLRAHGWIRDLPNADHFPEKNSFPLKEQYTFALPGFNVRPLDLSGALGLSQLGKLDEIIKNRRKNALLFSDLMQKHAHVFSIQKEKYGKSSWYSFTLIFNKPTPTSRDSLFHHLKNHQIESRMITGGCLTLHPMKKYFNFSSFETPIHAERIHNSGLFVANHAVDMTEMFEALDQALESFKDYQHD